MPPRGEGALVLDIGGDVGALILTAPAELVGREIHISPIGCADRRLHNVVRERRIGGDGVYAAVFPALPAGDYVVISPVDARASGMVTVEGGAVATGDCVARALEADSDHAPAHHS